MWSVPLFKMSTPTRMSSLKRDRERVAHFPQRKSPIAWCIVLIRKDHGEKHGPHSHKTCHETVRSAVPPRWPLHPVGQTACASLVSGSSGGCHIAIWKASTGSLAATHTQRTLCGAVQVGGGADQGFCVTRL